MHSFIKTEDSTEPPQTFSKFKKIKKNKNSKSLDKKSLSVSKSKSPVTSKNADSLLDQNSSSVFNSKIWELALSNHKALEQISLYPKSVQNFFNQAMNLKEEMGSDLKDVIYNLKTPLNGRSFEKKIEKMKTLNQSQEFLIDKFLQDRFFLSQNVAHFQEYLCFNKIVQLLKTNFEEFFHSLYPNFSSQNQTSNIAKQLEEKFLAEASNYIKQKNCEDFSKFLASFYHLKNNIGPNFLETLGMQNQTTASTTSPFDLLAPPPQLDKNFETNLLINSNEKFNNFLNMTKTFRMGDNFKINDNLKLDLNLEPEYIFFN